MRILAIDSSGLTAAVAVVEEDRVLADYTINYKKTHSQTLLPMIQEMAKMIELDLVSLDAIAVAGGPGSFTGLRIGSATAKGLGLALNKPIINVPTVDGLAYQVFGCEDIICPIMDARRNQVYTGLYTFSWRAGIKDGTKRIWPVFQVIKMQMAVSIEELIRHLNAYGKRVVFLGDGVPVYAEIIENCLNTPYSFAPSYMSRQRAAAVGALGIHYYKMGKFESAVEHKPEYLRVSQAERERAEKEKKEGVSVRKMRPEDAAAVAELEYRIFTDAWSEKSILDTMRQPCAICMAAEKGSQIVGYSLAYEAAGEAEISRFAVAQDQRGQGVGHALMQGVYKRCKEQKIKKILLDVRQSNKEARAFYMREGFVPDGIRRKFYSDPAENAVLMSRETER